MKEIDVLLHFSMKTPHVDVLEEEAETWELNIMNIMIIIHMGVAMK